MKKLLFWGIGILIVVFLLGGIFSGDGDKSETRPSETPLPIKPLPSGDKITASCKFPSGWERHSGGNPLKTTDEGKFEPAVVDLYGGDPNNFHIVGAIGDPFVLFDQGKFKMWYTASTNKGVLGTAYAESENGILWKDSKDKDNHAKLVLEPGSWDKFGVETVTVLKNPVNGKFHLYHTGNLVDGPGAVHKIGLATSRDGKNWQRHSNFVLDETFSWEKTFDAGGAEFGGVLEPTVLYNNGMFKMWYAAFGLYDKDEGFARIGYATSKDGISWTKNSNPVLLPGENGEWDDAAVSHTNVIKDPKKGFHMVYAGLGTDTDAKIFKIGHAYSDDGINWEKNPNNPIIVGRNGEWDQGMVGGPSALFLDDKIFVYYMGSKSSGFTEAIHFGLVSAICKN